MFLNNCCDLTLWSWPMAYFFFYWIYRFHSFLKYRNSSKHNFSQFFSTLYNLAVTILAHHWQDVTKGYISDSPGLKWGNSWGVQWVSSICQKCYRKGDWDWLTSMNALLWLLNFSNSLLKGQQVLIFTSPWLRHLSASCQQQRSCDIKQQ